MTLGDRGVWVEVGGLVGGLGGREVGERPDCDRRNRWQLRLGRLGMGWEGCVEITGAWECSLKARREGGL